MMSERDELLFESDQHVAGRNCLPLPIGIVASAVYGGVNNCYRYRLEWLWDAHLPTLMAAMMNPSTATEFNGDRTVSWVHRWASVRGFGRLIVVKAVQDHGLRMAKALTNAGYTLHAWNICKDGSPSHPLYLPSAIEPVSWSIPLCPAREPVEPSL